MTKPIKAPQTVEEAIAAVLDRDDARLIAELRDSLKATREARIKAKAGAFSAWVLEMPQDAKTEDFGGWVLTETKPEIGTPCISWRGTFDPDSDDFCVWIVSSSDAYDKFATHPRVHSVDEGGDIEHNLKDSLIAAIKAKGWKIEE